MVAKLQVAKEQHTDENGEIDATTTVHGGKKIIYILPPPDRCDQIV